MRGAFFITGTDTGSGKTSVTTGLMRAFRDRGEQAYGMKPVAAGCSLLGGNLVNDDALVIQRNSSINLPYSLVNPVALQQPCSPHIAAENEGKVIGIDDILEAFRRLSSMPGYLFVEGIGGWCVPLSGSLSMNDVAERLAIPVILVVGLRLGCINHALLTYQAICRSNLRLAGWVANQTDPDYRYSDRTVSYLHEIIDCNLLGTIPFLPTAELCRIDSFLEIDCLL